MTQKLDDSVTEPLRRFPLTPAQRTLLCKLQGSTTCKLAACLSLKATTLVLVEEMLMQQVEDEVDRYFDMTRTEMMMF
jgi:hypothetical protein